MLRFAIDSSFVASPETGFGGKPTDRRCPREARILRATMPLGLCRMEVSLNDES